MAYTQKELAAFLDGRNNADDFISVLERRLHNPGFKGKHQDYREKLAQLKRVDKAIKVLEGK